MEGWDRGRTEGGKEGGREGGREGDDARTSKPQQHFTMYSV